MYAPAHKKDAQREPVRDEDEACIVAIPSCVISPLCSHHGTATLHLRSCKIKHDVVVQGCMMFVMPCALVQPSH